jgi:hypothetical protein
MQCPSVQFFKHLLYCFQELRYLILAGVKDRNRIDIRIVVSQYISHPFRFFPINVRIILKQLPFCNFV